MLDNVHLHPTAAQAAAVVVPMMAAQLALAPALDLDDRRGCERHLLGEWWPPLARQFLDQAIAAARAIRSA